MHFTLILLSSFLSSHYLQKDDNRLAEVYTKFVMSVEAARCIVFVEWSEKVLS